MAVFPGTSPIMELTRVTVGLCLLISPALLQYNKMTMGPYDPIFQAIEECPNIGEGKIRFWFKPHRASRSEINLDANVSSSVQIDDTISVLANSAQFTNGGWKDNFFVKEFSKLCSITMMFIPDVMKKLAAAAGYPRGDKCPISPKNYTVRNFKMEIYFENFLPMFTYSKYRGDLYLKRGDSVLGCIRLYMDLVPKRRPKKKKGK